MQKIAVPVALMVVTFCGVFFIHSCDQRDQRIVAGAKQELVVDVQATALESHKRQDGLNNEAGIWLKSAEQVAREVTRVYLQGMDNAKTEEFDLDMPVPVAVTGPLRLRIAEAQRDICAGSTGSSNSACPAPTQKNTAAAGSDNHAKPAQVGR